MAANANLHKAKAAKNDEFYTQLTDVRKELTHYKHHFKDKIVLCNCDDPAWSAFWKYFHLNFSAIGLKKLISTHYDKTEPTYKMEYTGGDDNDIEVGVKTPLEGNGDFRNQECIDLLDECDIVVTNPPFSIAREFYIPLLYEHHKAFLIVGDLNWVTYKDVFPLLQNNQMWFGVNTIKEFLQPDGTMKKFGNKLWFTNLDHTKRHEKIICWKHYDESEYIKYDNYDVIDCCPTSTIPVDYDGIMGVPISYLSHHNPDQFEILGMGCGWNGDSDMLLKTYSSNQIQHTWDKKTKSFKSPTKVGKLNDGTPAIRLEKPYTDDTYYEVDGEYYARTYVRVFIRKNAGA